MTEKPQARQASSFEEKKRARRKSRRDRTREDILDAARSVVLREGAGGATLEAVAHEAGMSKTALYYYFPSKDAILFELVFGIFEARAREIHDATEAEPMGSGALHALIDAMFHGFDGRIEDFRLAFLYGQTSVSGGIKIDDEQLKRIRPLNDLMLAGAAEKLAAGGPNRAGVEPRLLAFLAHISAIGLLTMKGMVESIDDPLLYPDDVLVDALGAVFRAAAEPDQGT